MENNVYEMLSKMMANSQNQGQNGGGNFNNNFSTSSVQSQNPSFSYYPQEAYPNQESAPSASAMGFSTDNALFFLETIDFICQSHFFSLMAFSKDRKDAS